MSEGDREPVCRSLMRILLLRFNGKLSISLFYGHFAFSSAFSHYNLNCFFRAFNLRLSYVNVNKLNVRDGRQILLLMPSDYKPIS